MISGSPPVEAFGKGAGGLGPDDPRNMWPQVLRAVSQVRPRAVTAWTIPAMKSRFPRYWSYLQLALAVPSVPQQDGEEWQQHQRRLELVPEQDRDYDVRVLEIEAANYGAAQRRRRLVAVAFERRLGLTEADYPNPEGGYSRLALQHDQARGGRYWSRHRIQPRYELVPRTLPAPDGKKPWRTVRDVIWDLPQPRYAHGRSATPPPQRTARRPRLHTARPTGTGLVGRWGPRWQITELDQPIRAVLPNDQPLLRAAKPYGRRGEWVTRRWTSREKLRTLGVFDDYLIAGPPSAQNRQIGLMVAPPAGEAVARWAVEGLRRGTARLAAGGHSPGTGPSPRQAAPHRRAARPPRSQPSAHTQTPGKVTHGPPRPPARPQGKTARAAPHRGAARPPRSQPSAHTQTRDKIPHGPPPRHRTRLAARRASRCRCGPPRCHAAPPSRKETRTRPPAPPKPSPQARNPRRPPSQWPGMPQDRTCHRWGCPAAPRGPRVRPAAICWAGAGECRRTRCSTGSILTAAAAGAAPTHCPGQSPPPARPAAWATRPVLGSGRPGSGRTCSGCIWRTA